MALADFLNQHSIETGISSRADRHHKFSIKRQKSSHGFEFYLLENLSNNQSITIGRSQFDRFRQAVKSLHEQHQAKGQIDEIKLKFRNKVYFILKVNPSNPEEVVIGETEPRHDGTGYLVVHHSALKGLEALLFHDRLQHPNDILDRIIAYHKLFQFTFVQGSESITSDLILRKDILSEVVNYVPSSRKMVISDKKEEVMVKDIKIPKVGDAKNPAFKSRLAEKSGEKAYQVDFDSLFKSAESDGGQVNYKSLGGQPRNRRPSESSFMLPLHAGEVKNYKNIPFKCELSNDEVKVLREHFIDDRSNELYLGFEICDAIFKRHGQFKAFRFPLYYMKVSIRESNREIFIDPAPDDRIYLNHLALANLVEAFSKIIPGKDPIKLFFDTLLAQEVQIDDKLSKIYISRKLPFREDVFAGTREVLLGEVGENGRGGILGSLKIAGVECDLETVYLYKSKKVSAPLVAALEKDLDEISQITHESPQRFYSSLLGKFLTPQVTKKHKTIENLFCERPWIPGALPNSTRLLLHKLNQHDLVLLEGPPGTGKTFTIMNLFIHAVCTGKKILVVSDQRAAIDALVEKLSEYLLGRDKSTAESKNLKTLWQTAVKVINEIPSWEANLENLVNLLQSMMAFDDMKDLKWADSEPTLNDEIAIIDKRIKVLKQEVTEIIETQRVTGKDPKIAAKSAHDTTESDIAGLVQFVQAIDGRNRKSFLKSTGIDFLKIMEVFMADREYLKDSKYKQFYPFFEIAEGSFSQYRDEVEKTHMFLEMFSRKRPRTQKGIKKILDDVPSNLITQYFIQLWKKKFPRESHPIIKFFRIVKSLFHYPLNSPLSQVGMLIRRHDVLLDMVREKDVGFLHQLNLIHHAVNPTEINAQIPLCLELCRSYLDKASGRRSKKKRTVQEVLLDIESLQNDRAKIIKRQFILQLGKVANDLFKFEDKIGTSPLTSISALLSDIKAQGNVETAWEPIMTLQKRLLEAFPFWICRKQAVPFLLPCLERSFDLVIVDEATQCRVDDALPLLFRGDKLMVVGDEKQTVLEKNSAIDDYLFKEFNLDEHLRATHARAIKGGGSNIFGLVKSIKQASVMLDEHYRCPPDIIAYSNRYVYNNELKIMKWTLKDSPPTVIVDYSEKKATNAGRRTNGKYKGIDTPMLDRFLDFVEAKIKEIEKERGIRLDVEQDAAICYFLLKNEPYVKDKKPEFLSRLGRGSDILDGAGAALQGKERDYMFFYWDIDRSNMMAFKQGDQPDKRKGELNVLMSRPKKRAYHFLSKSFETLDHNKATITHYLWSAYKSQTAKEEKKRFEMRKERPGDEFVNWQRGSGQLIERILTEAIFLGDEPDAPFKTQYSVQVGNPHHKVDLMILPKKPTQGKSVALIDLTEFVGEGQAASKIVDYYFQLKRADPPVEPVFMFLNELVNERGATFQALLQNLEELKNS
jgi:hypothetical protein